MKIIDKAENSTTTFRDIKTESIFKLNDKILMKICSIGSHPYNAYDFSEHRLAVIAIDTEVRYVPSELILYQREQEE